MLYLVVGVLFIAGGLFTGRLIRPRRPNPQKLATYESGEEPMGDSWGKVNIRFYLLALIFLLFEVEIIFLFPWALVIGDREMMRISSGAWGWFVVIEMGFFIGVLFLGLLYAWKKGYLDWPGTSQEKRHFSSPVPREYYERINKKYSGI